MYKEIPSPTQATKEAEEYAHTLEKIEYVARTASQRLWLEIRRKYTQVVVTKEKP